MELFPEHIEQIELDAEAHDAAIHAATDYDRAGFEPGVILEHALKAYVLAVGLQKMTDSGSYHP